MNTNTRTAKKRGRVSSDEDASTVTVPLAKKPVSQITIKAASNILGTGKENIVNNSNQSTEAVKDSFLNPPDVPIQSQEKRARHSSDDIFGFGEPSQSKVYKTENSCQKSDNTLKSLKHDDEDPFGIEEPPKKVMKKFNPSTQLENNPGSNISSGSKATNIYKFESTGFLGKENFTIKSEVKTGCVEDTSGDVSALSASMVKVTLLNLLRPSTPKPSYVPSLNPDPLGKPVVNYKKFQKQSVDKTRAVISLVIYVPSDLSQSGIDEWFNQNQDVTRREQEREVLEKQAENFWNFHNSQSKEKMKTPFSRIVQNQKKKYEK
eukprot:GFUD01029277.1.p1 GENE.GFUD01029277.1~~GFUD01029277.1.p1  ORF type:complete len:320 (+),score=86.24 GFUD01029277.1:358-1317(+)